MGKTLRESADEILNTTLGAMKEPSKTVGGAIDLGGATNENPGGEGVGSAAASTVAPSPKPGVVGAPAEPASPNPAAKAPVVADFEKEAEETMKLSEEEFEELLATLSEEELQALADELDALEEKEDDSEENYIEEESDDEEEDDVDLEEAQKKAKAKMVAACEDINVGDLVKQNMGSMLEDVDALFNGESLSEDFRTKASTIFGAAVQARVSEISSIILEKHEVVLENAIAEAKSELEEQVDQYLNYVVENWMEENQLAIESGIRTEIAEGFMEGLKNLFVEHYIDIPASKTDVVEEMASTIAAMEEVLSEEITEKETLQKALNESKGQEILRRICEGLTEVQIQKIKALAEGVEFTTDGDYLDKLTVIRESYFPSKTVKSVAPSTIVETSDPKVADRMDFYSQVLSRHLPK